MMKKITATIRDWFSRLVRSGLFRSETTDEISPSILRGEKEGMSSDGNKIPEEPEPGDQVINSRGKPSDGYSGKVHPRGSDDETESDSCFTANGQDKPPETPIHPTDQPAPNDKSPESTSPADTGWYPRVPAEIEPSTSNSDKSQEVPSDPLDDTSQKASSTSTQPVKAHEHARNDDAHVGPDSSEDSSSAETHEEPEPTEPRQIRGRRASPIRPQPYREESTGTKPQFTPRPELICRRAPGTWQWEMVLSADDECNIVEVRHDGGEPLDIPNGECRLSSFAGSLSVSHEDGESRELKLFDGTPMVFKSSPDWKGNKPEGRTYFLRTLHSRRSEGMEAYGRRSC